MPTAQMSTSTHNKMTKTTREQSELNKNCLFTVLGPIKPHKWKVTRKIHIPKLTAQAQVEGLFKESCFKVAVTKLASHFRRFTPFTSIWSAIQLMFINTALLQPCHTVPAREMGLFFCGAFFFFFSHTSSNPDFQLATISYDLLFLGTKVRNSDNFCIYIPPLQLKYVILLFRMSYQRRYN